MFKTTAIPSHRDFFRTISLAFVRKCYKTSDDEASVGWSSFEIHPSETDLQRTGNCRKTY